MVLSLIPKGYGNKIYNFYSQKRKPKSVQIIAFELRVEELENIMLIKRKRRGTSWG